MMEIIHEPRKEESLNVDSLLDIRRRISFLNEIL